VREFISGGVDGKNRKIFEVLAWWQIALELSRGRATTYMAWWRNGRASDL